MDRGLVRFFTVGLISYLAWYVGYAYFLKDYTLVDEYLIHSMVACSEWCLKAMGYVLYDVSSTELRWQLGIANSPGLLQIGEACDGLVLFALFAVFILAFPGPLSRKAWFIPAGILAIHVANLIRVVSLVMLNYHKPEWLAFNHDYTWTILVYGFIFWLWYIWTDRFSVVKHIGG